MKSTIVVLRNGLFPGSESVFEKKKSPTKKPNQTYLLGKMFCKRIGVLFVSWVVNEHKFHFTVQDTSS